MTSLSGDLEGSTTSDSSVYPTARRRAWVRAWVIATVVCAFGPYLAGGMRTEQLSFYVPAVIVAAVLIRRRQVVPALSPGWTFVALWSLFVFTVCVGVIVAPTEWPWGSGSLVAGLDNALMPLAVMVVVAGWLRLTSAAESLRWASWTVSIAMAVNAVLALVTAFVGIDGLSWLRGFWASRGSGVTVAELASGSGRFSGVFNQPAEAGVAYTVAACCLVFLVRTSGRATRRFLLPLWCLVLAGGLLCFSKIVVVGGVVILAVLVLVDRRGRLVLSSSAVGTAALLLTLGSAGWLGNWGVSTTLQWYAESVRTGDSLVYTITAGRFGEGDLPTSAPVAPDVAAAEPDLGADKSPEPPAVSSVQQPGGLVALSREVVRLSPAVGFGAAGAQVAYDSTWVEALIVGGLVGLALVFAVHLAVSWRFVRLRGRLPREEWQLGSALVVLMWGSSLGMPSLTGNRESALMWVFLSLLIVFRKPRSAGAEQSAPGHRSADA